MIKYIVKAIGEDLLKTKKKKKTEKWVKLRHKIIFNLLRPFFGLYFKIKYKFTASKDERKVPSPALIMSNHSTTMDPFLLGMSFKRPIYYITSDDLFTIPFVSRLIKWLVNPIPKSKSKSDLGTIRTTLKVLKEGGTVAIFPEGNRTLFGTNWDIDISTAKLVKVCRVPLVLYNINGGYGADPRWGNKIRKGKMTAGVVKVLSIEEIDCLSPEQLLEVIKEELTSKDIPSSIRFKYRRRAEFLERALYYCENCGAFNSLYSDKDKIYCRNCDFKAEYSEDLKLKAINGKLSPTNTAEYLSLQKGKLRDFKNENKDLLFFDKEVEARMIYDKKRHKLGDADIFGYSNGVKVKTKKEEYFCDFSCLYGVTILGKRKINFYLDDDKTLQIKGSKRFNGVKYLHLFELSKEKK